MNNNNTRESRINVLLIDDEKDFLEQMQLFLEKENSVINTEGVTSGNEALQLLDKKNYECVVSDYQMPEMNGLELLKKVRDDMESDIPFIMFTGRGREEVAMKALNLRANRYLQKGGDPKSQYGVLSESIIREVKLSKVKSEKEKVESEFSSIVEGSNDPIYIVDSNIRILFANQAFLDDTNLDKEEIIGTKFSEINPELNTKIFRKKVQEVIETGEPQKQEVKHKESGKYYKRTINPIKDPKKGEVDRVSVISKDFTELKNSEERLKDLNSIRKAIRDINQLIIRETDLKTLMLESTKFLENTRNFLETFIILKDNENNFDLFAHSWEESVSQIKDNDQIDLKTITCLENISNSKSPLIIESSQDYCGGCNLCKQDIDHKGIVAPLKRNGEFLGVLSTAMNTNREINEDEINLIKEVANDLAFAIKKIEAEKKLEKSNEKFEKAIENAPQPILLHTENGEIILTNKKFTEITGYTKEDLLTIETWLRKSFENKKEKINKLKQEMLNTKEKNPIKELEITTKDGKKRIWNIETSYLGNLSDNKGLIMKIADDSTKRKEIEKEMNESNSNYRILFQNLNEGSAILEIDYEEDSEKAIDYKFININDKFKELFNLEKENTVGRKGSDIFGTDKPPYLDRFVKVMKDNKSISFEDYYEPTDKHFEVNAIKLKENKLGVFITDKTKFINLKDQEEFFHSLLRHDLRNKLNISLGYSQLLKDTELTEKQKEIIGKDWSAKHTAMKLTEDIEKLRKIKKENLNTVEISSLVKKAINKYEEEAKQRNIKIQSELKESYVKGGSLLEEVFSNILLNGIIHSKGDKIHIKLKEEEENELAIIFEDNGKGISKEKKEKIFDKGYKNEDTGVTGLGLYLVKEIINSFDGKIFVKDSDLGGARFEVRLRKQESEENKEK